MSDFDEIRDVTVIGAGPVGLALANLVLRDRPKLNRLQTPSLKFDIGDHAFPSDRFIEQCVGGRHLENEIPQIEKDRTAAIDLDAMQQRSAVHDDDVRSCVHLGMCPFLQPGGRSEPLGVIDFERFNVTGGSIAIGHPFGATGSRVVTQLLYELRHRDQNLGLVTICAAGGVGFAMVVERA